MKMLVKMIKTCEILLTVGKHHDRQPWPETRIFIEMDSACRTQQGNCDEVEHSARQFLVIFSALWLNLCNNSDQTLFSNALTFARSLGTWQTLMHGKTCLIPILDTRLYMLLSSFSYYSPNRGGRVVRWCWVNFQCLGVLLILDCSRTRAYCACRRCGWGLFGHFFSHLSLLFSFSLSLGDGPI